MTLNASGSLPKSLMHPKFNIPKTGFEFELPGGTNTKPIFGISIFHPSSQHVASSTFDLHNTAAHKPTRAPPQVRSRYSLIGKSILSPETWILRRRIVLSSAGVPTIVHLSGSEIGELLASSRVFFLNPKQRTTVSSQLRLQVIPTLEHRYSER
nr:hypothetical protein Iba_chr08dCG8620 [Ipomoea batatas]